MLLGLPPGTAVDAVGAAVRRRQVSTQDAEVVLGLRRRADALTHLGG